MIRFTQRQAKYAAALLQQANAELLERRVNLCYERDYFRWARNHGYKLWKIDAIRGLDQLRAEIGALVEVLTGAPADPQLEPAPADPAWGGGDHPELSTRPAFKTAVGWWED